MSNFISPDEKPDFSHPKSRFDMQFRPYVSTSLVLVSGCAQIIHGVARFRITAARKKQANFDTKQITNILVGGTLLGE